MVEKVGTHNRVFEYDGAYKCSDCGVEWGALPGNPVMPKSCNPKSVAEKVEWCGCYALAVVSTVGPVGESAVIDDSDCRYAKGVAAIRAELAKDRIKLLQTAPLELRIAIQHRIKAREEDLKALGCEVD